MYSPTSKTSCLESGRTNKLLMRRYATMQKGRDSDVFGILVGTLGVGEYHDIISIPGSNQGIGLSSSVVPSLDQAHPCPSRRFSQKKLHNQCRQAQSSSPSMVHIQDGWTPNFCFVGGVCGIDGTKSPRMLRSERER